MEDPRPSTSKKKDLLKSYKNKIEDQLSSAKAIFKSRIIIKNVFKILISISLTLTTTTALLQIAEYTEAYTFVVAVASVLNAVLTSLYNVLNLETVIVKADRISRSCNSLLLELDRILLIADVINDNFIDSFIERLSMIMNQSSIENKDALQLSIRK